MCYLIDGIFENMPKAQAKDFPVNFIKTLPVGVDLDPLKHKFLYWLLMDKDYGVIRFAVEEADVRKAIEGMAKLHERAIAGDMPPSDEWAARAEEAAWAAQGQANKLIALLGEA